MTVNCVKNKFNYVLFSREISGLNPKTNTYKAVGRMFILQDIADVKTDLKKRQTSADEKVKSLENNKTYLERNLKEAENNLREMVQHRKELC